MYDLDVQIRDYIDATSTPVSVDEVLHVPVGDEPVRPFTPRGGGRRPLTGWLVAGAAAAIVVLVIGAVGVLPALRSGGESVVEPTTSTTVVETVDTSAIAESFAQARSDGDIDAVMALLVGDASVDMGPAAAPSDIPAEMRWQHATGLTFTFGRCEPGGAPTDGSDASYSCFVTWTGSVATSLGYGADTFEYAIDVVDDRIVSAALVDLGGYQETTWRPFRDWMLQQHPDDIATMYTPDGHAVLTDDSIDLWRLRTTEFVEEQTGPITTTEAPKTFAFAERGELEVNWVKHTGQDGTQPYGIDTYDAGVYTTVTEDGRYTSEDARTWTFESAAGDALLPDDISDDGQWGMAMDFLTGTLLRNVDDEWQAAPRPPQADQSGDWVWMRQLASSEDILLVIGGPPDPIFDPPYPLIEAAAYWRIDNSGEWQKSVLGWDDSFYVHSVPAGGFAYTNDGSIHTSVDGFTWIDRGPTLFPFWEEGVFPGLLHATIQGAGESQVWTSPDAVKWTYEFTTPHDDNAWQRLDLTNHGFVVTQLSEDDPVKPTASYVESWLLNADRRTWTALTTFKVPGCEDCATAMGAAGDVVYVSRSTSDSSALMYLATITSD